MAGIQKRNGSFRAIFRYQGKQHSVTLGKVSQDEAEAKGGAIDLLLLRIKQELLAVPEGVTIEEFVLSDGRARPPEQALAEGQAKKDEPTKLSDFKEKYLELRQAGQWRRTASLCRHERFNAFRRAWAVGLEEGSSRLPSAPEIDDSLRAERLIAEGVKRTFVAALGELPEGGFVTVREWGEGAYLVWGDGLHEWSAGGYTERLPRPDDGVAVTVLTPASSVAALRAGYVPEVHGSMAVK